MPVKTALIGTILLLGLFIFGCTAKKTSPPKETFVQDQIIVLLGKNKTPTPLIETLEAYEAKAKGPTSRSKNQWIISFNAKLIQPEKMLEKIKSSESVLEASFLPLKTEL